MIVVQSRKRDTQMILYLTKQTFERYKIVPPEKMRSPIKEITAQTLEKEQGNSLLEWGGKLFYFDRRKCIQFTNFASKFTIFLFDFKVGDLQYIGDGIYQYLFDFYKDNAKMKILLRRLANEHPVCVFDRLKNRSVIATLNHTQTDFALDGYRFYDYIENNVLQSKKINRVLNSECLFSEKVEGKSFPNYFYSGEKFESCLREYYADK